MPRKLGYESTCVIHTALVAFTYRLTQNERERKMDNTAKLEQMKAELLVAIYAAEKLAYAYFCECDVGGERTLAHAVYENIRNATRV